MKESPARTITGNPPPRGGPPCNCRAVRLDPGRTPRWMSPGFRGRYERCRLPHTSVALPPIPPHPQAAAGPTAIEALGATALPPPRAPRTNGNFSVLIRRTRAPFSSPEPTPQEHPILTPPRSLPTTPPTANPQPPKNGLPFSVISHSPTISLPNPVSRKNAGCIRGGYCGVRVNGGRSGGVGLSLGFLWWAIFRASGWPCSQISPTFRETPCPLLPISRISSA